METFVAFYFVGFMGVIVLAIGWIILPFALIGTKPLLRTLIAETKRTNTLLEAMGRQRDDSEKDHRQSG